MRMYNHEPFINDKQYYIERYIDIIRVYIIVIVIYIRNARRVLCMYDVQGDRNFNYAE